MSTNAKPREHALVDDTLRRSGRPDLSGEVEESNTRPPLPNPRKDIIDSQHGGRGHLGAKDWELHAGRPPERIDRLNNTRVFGLTGKAQFGKHERHGEMIRVGHIPTSHPNRPVSGNPSVAYSDSTYIPAQRIGQPL